MSWPRFSLRYRYTIFAALIGIIIFGVVSRFELPVQLFPDTDPPVVTIITSYVGVSPTDMAKNVSKVIEEEVGGIDGVKRVTSISQVGLSIVKAEFHFDKDVQSATLDVQNALGRIRPKLPVGIQEPQVLNFSSSDKPIVTLAVRSSTLTLEEVREFADNDLKDAFQLVSGVAAVDVFGGHKKQLEIILHRDRLKAYQLTTDQIKQALANWNIVASGGRVNKGAQETVVRFDLSLQSVEQAKNIVVSSREGKECT